MVTAWMVRAGRDGERETTALTEGLIIAGWEEVGDLSQIHDKSGVRDLLERTYPDASRATIGNWTGQLWRLLHEIAVDDLVVIPLKNRVDVAVGQVTGNYEYRGNAPPGFRHVRAVRWIDTAVRRANIRQDLLDSMGSLLTVCRLERFGAAERIKSLAERGVDPGPQGNGAPEDVVTSKQQLATRAAAATADEPFRISVRDLLAVWGATRRSSGAVAQIEADLGELGLTTSPTFTDVWINDEVAVVAVGKEPGENRRSIPNRFEIGDDSTDSSPLAPRIGMLEPANTRQVESVRPVDSIDLAVTKMIAHNYSQLAVVDDEGQLRGAISWGSIGTRRVATSPDRVADAAFPVRAVNHRELLLPLVEEIGRVDFLFVCSDDHPLTGIVTAADLTKRFDQMIRPLVLIEEAERRLRRRVLEVFDPEDIAQHTTWKSGSKKPLTIGNYKYLLKDFDRWAKLGWKLDHALFIERLGELNSARNDFMHFNPDPLTGEQLDSLEGFVRVLRAVDSRD